jgi:carbamoyl-phosphate synthase large subunit
MNILITGIGAIIGYGIIESLKLSRLDVKIIGTDIFPENYGKYQCDVFHQVPLTSDPDYFEFIQKIILENSVDLIFPGIEQDLHFFNQNRIKFDTAIVLNKAELIELSKDKMEMYNFLKTNDFKHLIPTEENLNFEVAKKRFGLPFVIKPKKSYASKGFYVINSEKDFINIAHQISSETLFQPYIGTNSEEYTVSIFGNGKGGYFDQIIMKRTLSAAGASEKTSVVLNDEPIESAINDLCKLFSPVGPTNFQFRKDKGLAYLLEINPRISSACSIRSKFGYNEPLMCIDFYLQNQQPKIEDKLAGRAVRFISDFIIYE